MLEIQIKEKIAQITESTDISLICKNLEEFLILATEDIEALSEACEELIYSLTEKIESFSVHSFMDNVYIFDSEQSVLHLLLAYINNSCDQFEIIDSIEEFINNCSNFTSKSNVSSEEVVEILNDIEDKCQAISYISKDKPLNIFDSPNILFPAKNYNNYNYIILYNLYGKSMEKLSDILYEQLIFDLGVECFNNEISRYLPEAKFMNDVKLEELFKRKFAEMLISDTEFSRIITENNVRTQVTLFIAFLKKIIELCYSKST